MQPVNVRNFNCPDINPRFNCANVRDRWGRNDGKRLVFGIGDRGSGCLGARLLVVTKLRVCMITVYVYFGRKSEDLVYLERAL